MKKYDYNKLKGKIKEVFETQDKFAEALGRSSATINERLNNKKQFTQDEINDAILLLNIQAEEIKQYFFNQKVE